MKVLNYNFQNFLTPIWIENRTALQLYGPIKLPGPSRNWPLVKYLIKEFTSKLNMKQQQIYETYV